jgi:hypothetical protein
MAIIPTVTGNDILVDSRESADAALRSAKTQPGAALVSWVIGKVTPWEQYRDNGYRRLWGEYWRLWRGKWTEEDRTRTSERSRIIAPALATAIDMTVSELEEAVFAKEVWFDISDDIRDDERVDALLARDQLLEDLNKVGAEDAISEAVLNAAIFGTGVVKINTFVAKALRPSRDALTGELGAQGDERVYVTVESIRPDEFIPDPDATTIEDMLGCAHRTKRPYSAVLAKIESGVYRKDAAVFLGTGGASADRDRLVDFTDPQAMMTPQQSNAVDIVEWHGRVPVSLLAAVEADSAVDSVLASEEDAGATVEAIVTIANESVLLRAMPNPFVMRDRSIIAFQLERVPGRFWGRGVSEKGYNPQKSLDATIRAYMDALGFVASPMLGIDIGRVPKGTRMEVKPGKVWGVQGVPSDILHPVSIGNLDVGLFQQATEMERMVQMGTGAFDTATSLKNQSASGSNSLSANSMLMGAFVKRAKRAVQNVSRKLLTPIIQKAMWRYMQFDPSRYPRDYDFNVKATMGIVAREVEAMQLTQLVGMMPQEYGKAVLPMVIGVIENSAVSNKAQILKTIDSILNPPEEEVRKAKELQELQTASVRAEAQGRLLANQKTIAEIRKLLAEAMLATRKADVEDQRVQIEVGKLQQMANELDLFEEQNALQAQQLRLKDRELDIKEKQVVNVQATARTAN